MMPSCDAREPRDLETRCVCEHLLFIHIDADRCVPVGDEPPYGVVYERKGRCLHAGCACREPRAAASTSVAARTEAA